MNPITLLITLADGNKLTAVAVAPDFVAFEAKFDKSIQVLGQDVRLTYMFFLAWHALHRTKQIGQDFEAWLELVSDIEVQDPKA